MTLLRCRAPASRGLVVAAASVLLAVVASTVASGQATAAPAEQRDACSPSDEVLRYLVLFDEGTTEKQAEREVSKACGKQTVYYPGIAVGVANSRDASFEERLGPDRAFSAQALRRRDSGGDAAADSGATARPRLEPTDPRTVAGSNRADEQWDMRMINAEAARAINPGTSDIVVGVLDSGIDSAHPDLSDAVDSKVSAGCLSGKPDTAKDAWAPTTSEHGTHIAGTIAAADDGSGVTGVAPGVRLASVKVIGERGYVDPEAAVCGLMWAAKHKMSVTNSSYFVDPLSESCSRHDGIDVVREAITRAADYAARSGTLNVAAATNDAVNLSPVSSSGGPGCEALPASLRSVVAVSSVGENGVKAGYSSYGLGVITLAAPGGEDTRCVLSTVPGGYERICGTSMAAPHVTGVAALIAAQDPDSGPDDLRRSLTSAARQTACPTDYDLTDDGHQDAYCSGYRAYNGFYGHGIVDALSAVRPLDPSDDEPVTQVKVDEPPEKARPPKRAEPAKEPTVTEQVKAVGRQLTVPLGALLRP